MKILKKFVIFCSVGFIAFILDWLFFNLTYILTSLFTFSLGVGWVISMIFNFTTNRNLTFRARGHSISRQITKWLIIYAIAFLARIGTGEFILLFFEENTFIANIAYFAGIIVMIPISFLGSLFWVFRKK